MRANLAQNEPASIKRWEQWKLYDQIQEASDDAPKGLFSFHDGPPYANGSLHVGHLLNKCLKDITVRSRILLEYACPFVPGWDCHGLPIEHKVLGDMLESGKAEKLNALDEDTRRMAIRRQCQQSAEKFIKLQRSQLQRLMTLADYENPYLTMNPDYEREVLHVFADLFSQGIVYRALKPVHWSIANQTALAEAELEYEDREDLSVYVLFPAVDHDAIVGAFGVEIAEIPAFMIWTTTPWTLPANMAIAVHEKYQYALARFGDVIAVVAEEMIPRIEKAKGVKAEILAVVPGSALLGLSYRHPFCQRVSPIVHAEYVTLEDGTGLVHTAPGHGVEDHQTCLHEGIEVYCPVLDDGSYDDSVPDWLVGKSVWEGNDLVTEHLRGQNFLFYDHRFTHSYPHDWRSKTPVIFRCTEQWFVGVDAIMKSPGESLRQSALRDIESSVKFLPEWGRNRMRGMLDSRPDWCISRQRAWGLPIPVFRRPDGSVFMTPASIMAISDAFGERGSNAWFTDPPEQLLATYDRMNDMDAPDDLDIHSLEKMYDIFDVWFESGSSWHAVMESQNRGYPIDLYLEGSDQHRGWFQLSMLPAIASTGRPPFKTVLTHGFMVDKDGRKMSKSGGNALDFNLLIEKYGAEVCRWWVSSLAYDNDIKVDISFFDLASDGYRKIRNTIRFLLSNLFDYDPSSEDVIDIKSIDPASIDGWVLDRTDRLEAQVLDSYRDLEFRRVHQQLYDFCNETLSSIYCAAVKDRLYCDQPSSPRRRATQATMWEILEVLCRLLSPILPHTADEAYRAMVADDADRTVLDKTIYRLSFDCLDEWQLVMQRRDEALKALEDAKANGIDNSLDAGLRLLDEGGVLLRFRPDLADLCGVSRVELVTSGPVVEVIDLREEPRCERSWKRDETVSQREDGSFLSTRDAEAVEAQIVDDVDQSTTAK